VTKVSAQPAVRTGEERAIQERFDIIFILEKKGWNPEAPAFQL
jgi:hypothetical protein